MHQCFHPVRVLVPHSDGDYRLVPCGKCSACLKNRSESWRDRLRVEASQHKYCFFVTLTYSDKYVPCFYPEEVSTYDSFTDIERLDVFSYVTTHDCSSRYLVLRRKDIQNFFKRLRYYIYEDNKVQERFKSIRYFACGEYGETTRRPHYHLLIFSDCDYLCQVPRGRKFCRLYSYVRKAWQVPSKTRTVRFPIGRIDFQLVRDDAASYVSSYLNSFSSLPSLLRLKAFRPFNLASKAPPIGSFKFNVAQAKKILLQGLREFDNSDGSEYTRNVNIPLFKSLKDSLFPKCIKYSVLSSSDRFALYGIARFPYQGASFKEFYSWLNERKSSLFDLIEEVFSDSPLDSLYHLWRQSCQVLVNCSIFDLSLSVYVNRIEFFYSKSDYDSLVKQLEFEENFCLGHDSRYLPIYIDGLVFERYSGNHLTSVLSSFGWTDDDDVSMWDYFSLPEVVDSISSIESFVYVGKQYKAIKDYFVKYGSLSNSNVI